MKESVNFDNVLTKAVATLYNCGSFTESRIQFIIDSHNDLLDGTFRPVLKIEEIVLLSKAVRAEVVTDKELKYGMFVNRQNLFDCCQNITLLVNIKAVEITLLPFCLP